VGKDVTGDNIEHVKRPSLQEHKVPRKVLKMDNKTLSTEEKVKTKDQSNTLITSSRASQANSQKPKLVSFCNTAYDDVYAQCLQHATSHPSNAVPVSLSQDTFSNTISHWQSDTRLSTPSSQVNSSYNYIYHSPYHASYESMCNPLNNMTTTPSTTVTSTKADPRQVDALDHNFLSQLDPDFGYSSHSTGTGSSCQGQHSQGDGIYMDQPSQEDSNFGVDSASGDFEDLVYQFGKFIDWYLTVSDHVIFWG